MSLVRVWTDVGEKKPKALLAKIFFQKDGVYTIRYLSPFGTFYKYEEDEYEIDDDSVCEWLGTDDEEDIGFEAQGDGTFKRAESDPDYEPSESEEDESDWDEDGDAVEEEEEEEFSDEEDDSLGEE
jgi:hypothetical protein